MAQYAFNCNLQPLSDGEVEIDDTAYMEELFVDIIEWFQYCQMNNPNVGYYRVQQRRISRYPFARNGHMFMLDAMNCSPQQCYAEFRMYPAMLRAFTHVLRDEYGLRSQQHIDVYEQVGMFLCILAHGKGYRQVQTLFNHSLETIGRYFKLVLEAVVEFSFRQLIKPDPNYNHGAEHHVPNVNKHTLFQDCIGAIDGTHVTAVLSRDERVSFIGRKGIPTQNVLAACDFNLCFTFVLAGSTGNSHDARLLSRVIHDPEIDFPQPACGKYYLVDSGFAHRPGYMAPYKGSDILYHFQQFYDGTTGRRRQFRNAREKFNFQHSSCRNVIERAFGVWKSRWKILDRMPSYNFKVQTGVVIATMGIHNFLRRAGAVDDAFTRAETDPDAAEVDLPDEREEVAAEMHAPETQRNEWDMFRDYLAHQV